MKFKKGQYVSAKLIEQVKPKEWIVSFAGDLYRVRNESQQLLKENQLISLRIEEASPLVLSLSNIKPHRHPREMDIKV